MKYFQIELKKRRDNN